MSDPALESYDNTMRDFSARIERAQSEGKSRLANSIYQDQMAYIGRAKGNGPIVDGRRTA